MIKETNLQSNQGPTCSPKTKWYREKLFLVMGALVLFHLAYLILNYFGIDILNALVLALWNYLEMIWIPIFVGLLLGGVIDHFFPRKYIFSYLAQHRKRTIFYAVGLGFFMSACSHGILAIAMELHKKGASTPAVIAFLLASPWANLPVTILLFGLFGLGALYFIGSAIIIALITGFIYQWLEKKKLITPSKHKPKENLSVLKDLKNRWSNYSFNWRDFKKGLFGVLKGSWSLTKMVLWWILIGSFFAALARAYIPKGFFTNYMGASIIGLLVTLALATVIEVCSEGSAPLAFEIFKQSGALGNAFVFLTAGVATDYTEIGLIWSNIGKRAALWLPVITVPQIVGVGYLFNVLF